VVLVTSGPGATNTVTGIADAYSSGISLIVITGQVASTMLGADAFQETDMINITSSITKWNCQIREAEQNILLAIDKVPNYLYQEEYFGYNKVLKLGLFGVPGLGLPAAIGAKYAMSDKTICLVSGELEFQATIKELEII
jgi:thiamine pyrophosphate-dependent acetolactate synthase large subunit-like protein